MLLGAGELVGVEELTVKTTGNFVHLWYQRRLGRRETGKDVVQLSRFNSARFALISDC